MSSAALSDITRHAGESYSVDIKTSELSGILFGLVNEHKLQRLKGGIDWSYCLSKSAN
ncbi:hypothetical protein SAMN05216464_103202 [Mucilaginibacter pineti]|uniref:Uncharacterized protein n=1 Tax=Mucilaginibacter pineti TaxID=1391627 RepID=A0A1G6Z4G6_9SPHI|nr:hypothetical protein SAMN05216464_103202 [Mucilaginibacter pineti]